MRERIINKILLTLFLLLVMVPFASASDMSKLPFTASNAPSYGIPLPAPPIVGSTTQLAPVRGVLRVIVIAAQFSDINSTVSVGQLRQEWVGQVNQYYQEISYGTVSLQADVFGWYTLPYVESHYGLDCLGIDDSDCTGSDSSWMIASDSVQAAQHDVNFTNYDYFVFVHSGYGQESSGVKNDVWSVTYLGGVWVQARGRSLNKFSIDPELEAGGASPIGVFAHEFGHQLGLPDLYNTQTGRTIMGPWTLMDAGLWNGNPPGSTPAHMDSWSKIQLGWIGGSTLGVANPGYVSNYTIDPTELESNNIHAVQVLISSSVSSKYYLVEVRQRSGFDSALPSAGVLILYVDETATVGRVQVMDANPGVSGLRAATWTVGQTFSDASNGITIAVTGQVGNSYQIRVGQGGPIQPPTQNYVQLTITKIFTQPAVITLPNTTVTIFVDIANQGTQSASNVLIEVDLDGSQYTTTHVSVNAGSTVETSFTWKSVVGSHLFKVIIDPLNALNELSRAGNVATFTVYVGPTLTINVPLNLVSNGSSVWVKINSVQYKLNSTQLQASVPTGTITVQIQSAVNTSQGVRQSFSRWSDGNGVNPRQITVTNNTQLTAMFNTQYLLTVNRNQGTTSLGGWYNSSSIASVTSNATSNVIPNWSRLVFTNWSGDYNSTSTALSINMTKPVTLQANWIRQYYVTILSSTGSPSGAGWYNVGTTASVTVQPIVQFSNGTREVFTGWNVTSMAQAPDFQFPVNSPTRLQAIWKLQYFIQAVSSYGAPQGSGWYDAGTVARLSIQPQVDYSNRTRRIFTGWTGDYSGTSTSFTLTANKPINVAAQWATQYQVTFKVSGLPNSTSVTININNASYPLTVNQPYSAWYNQGQTLDPTANETVMTYFQFASWRNSTGFNIAKPITVTAPAEYTASYLPTLPLGIPGYPIESILVGIIAGLLAISVTRQHRRHKKYLPQSPS